jgi:NADH-quinone oxidoreductase subunit H
MLQIANPPMGILLMLAMSGISVYGVMLAGWSSGSKYPLLSSVRASAQMISYEAALGMTIVTVVLVTGSLSTTTSSTPSRGLLALEPDPPRHRALRRLLIADHRRTQPAALRRRRGRERAGRRLPHRVLLDPLRALLLGRVHEHHHDVGDHRDALLRRPGRLGAQRAAPALGLPDHLVPHQDRVVRFCYVWFRAALPRFRYDQLMDLGWKR